ncbi:MAG: RHS repeat-associated core domain-containing protein, partial [Phycisphaerae bacterium]|nr:RHS repeat-associated core domain-containing protein [Phycisphaerae bacterium]
QAKVTYAEFKNGESRASRASGSSFSITDNTAYTMKAVVTESGGLQTLNVYIAGTLRLTTGTIDDSWSAGYVGLWRDKTDDDSPAVTLDQTFDNFKAGTDQNADGDIDDAGDHVFVNFDFAGSWQTLSLSYDDNGNLTADGVYKYRYDAWNRLVATCYPSGDITVAGQRIGQYEYDGKNRRLRRVVTNRGAGAWQADANGEYRYFYDDQWRIVEVRNGSGQVKQQWLFGTQYVDEIVLMDNNGPTDTDDDCDPDTDLLSEIAVAGDQRYFYHQDRNWNVVALSTITDGSSYINGDIVERYSYTPYGEPTVIAVTAASGGTGNVRGASLAGNVFLHQGLPIDREKASYQNRRREYANGLQRFEKRDPLTRGRRPARGYGDGMNVYQAVRSLPTSMRDPSGLGCELTFNVCSETGNSTSGCSRDCQYTCTESAAHRATVATASCGKMECADLVRAGLLPPPGQQTRIINSRTTNWCCALTGWGGPPGSCPAPPPPNTQLFCEGPIGNIDIDCAAADCRSACDQAVELISQGCEHLPASTPPLVRYACQVISTFGPQACGDVCNSFCD